MERCARCGASTPPGQAWCAQCFAPTGASVSSGASVMTSTASAPGVPGRTWAPAAASALPAPPARRTRWGKTATTFGPLGRVSATLAVLVPLVVMVVGGMADPFVWGGAVVWLVVIVPWAMRDIWKAGQVPVR